MLFKRKKKTEQTDELHHEYGLISNCGYIIRAFLRYRKSTVAFLLFKPWKIKTEQNDTGEKMDGREQKKQPALPGCGG